MLRILHQDEQVVAVDKPAGILTVPGRNDPSVPLSALVRERFPDALPVHRLDRDTSGVVLFALGRLAHRALNAAFESRRAEKLYLALVRGDLAESRRIELPLLETRRAGVRVAEPGEKGAQAALTEVEPRERFGAYTLCECRPRTGRSHQIRVHLAAIGHPLAFDPQYGEARPLRIGELWKGPVAGSMSRRAAAPAGTRQAPTSVRRGYLRIASRQP